MTADPTPPRRRASSARDVARRAGVSIATVSLVVNGKADGRVSPGQQEVVRRAVADLGYRVDSRARELVTGQRSTVALLLPELSSPFFGYLAMGVSSVLGGGYDLVLAIAERRGGGAPDQLDRLVGARVGGVICHAPPDAALRGLGTLAAAVVLLDEPGTAWAGPSVLFDLGGGADSLAAHLLDLGHRHIAYLTPEPDSPTFSLRRAAVLRHFAAGSGGSAIELRAGNDFDAAAAAIRAVAAVGRLNGRSAIVCGTDDQAYGVLLALAELNIAVPDEISVCAFNDLPHSRVVRPALTSVALPARRLGSCGAELLLEVSAAERAGRRWTSHPSVVPTALAVRASTGAAPRRS